MWEWMAICGYDFHTSPTTSTHHLRLPNITYDFHTQPNTSTHHLRLVHSLPTSLTAYPPLSQPTHVSHSLPTSLTAYPRLSQPTHVSHSREFTLQTDCAGQSGALAAGGGTCTFLDDCGLDIYCLRLISLPYIKGNLTCSELQRFLRLNGQKSGYGRLVAPTHVSHSLPTSLPDSPAYPEREKP